MKNRKSALPWAAAAASAALLAGVPTAALAATPPAPPSQTLNGQSFSSSPAKAIPDGSANDEGTSVPGVATDTIVVGGAGPVLHDLDVNVGISHSFSPDLTVTLTSPAGTEVTLVSRVPSQPGDERYPPYNATDGYPDLFINTLFDDQATSPAASNNYGGPMTSIPASKLIPEEALAAFQGENPNGTWTLKVTDKLLGDVGVLNSWRLDLNSVGAAPSLSAVQTFSSNATPVPIPDNGAKVSKTVTVSGVTGYLWDVDARVVIPHTETRDLKVDLVSPSGVTIPLSVNRGGGGWFGSTVFNDSAQTLVTDEPPATDGTKPNLVPEGAMGQVIGTNPNGAWKLEVQDSAAGDTGNIILADINIRAAGAPGAAPPTSPNANRLPASIASDDACKKVPKRRTNGGGGKVRVSSAAMKIQQNQISVAILRLNAINARARGGFFARDLCGFSFGAEDFSNAVKWAGGANNAAAPANPRRMKFPKFRKKGAKFQTTKRQAAINDTLANFVLAKALATRKRYNALGGGDLRAKAVTSGKLHNGLQVVSGAGAGGVGPRSTLPKFTWKKTRASQIRTLNAAYLLRTQRKSQRAIRILNQITDEIHGGLKGKNFRNKQAPGSKLG